MCVCVCVEKECVPATAGHSPNRSLAIFSVLTVLICSGFYLAILKWGVKARERLRVLNSTELKFNLQRFIDGESAPLFAQFIAASFFCVRCC